MNKQNEEISSNEVPTRRYPEVTADSYPGVGPGIPSLLSDKAKNATSFMRKNVAEDMIGIPFRNDDIGVLKPLTFSDLSDEKYRVYCYPDGTVVRLDNPKRLNVSKSGGHRVYTADGISHYVHPGWNHLWWEVYEPCNHFAF